MSGIQQHILPSDRPAVLRGQVLKGGLFVKRRAFTFKWRLRRLVFQPARKGRDRQCKEKQKITG
jgi:hypothetical protein